MSETQEDILANVDYHARLLTTICQLEYVPSAIKHQVNYIEDLEGQLATIQKEVTRLAEKTKKERKEHEALRDSTSRRFAYTLLGKAEKFEAKANKEEREYVEALEREVATRNSQAAVQQLLKEGRNELKNLTEKEEQLHSAKTELTALYCRVLDEPTESFPEDDRGAENLVRAGRFLNACLDSIVQEALEKRNS